MQNSAGKIDSHRPLESSRMQNATMESTESGPAKKAAELALDLMFGLRPEQQQALPAPYTFSHTVSCFQHIKFLKAKLSTLNALHQIGLCHGSVNSNHFFQSGTSENFCTWAHADTTAFHDGPEFEKRRLHDIIQAAAEHLPRAHAHAVLEQAPVKTELEQLSNLLNTVEVENSAGLPEHLHQLMNQYLSQLAENGFDFGEDQAGRSSLWIKGMNSETRNNLTVYSHPNDANHPRIHEWLIPKTAVEQNNVLCKELDTQLKQQTQSSSKLLAWTQFEEQDHVVIRAAFNPIA